MTERMKGADPFQHDLFTTTNADAKRSSLNEVVNLARVIGLISSEHNSTARAFEFMCVLKTLFSSVQGDKIESEQMLYRRFRNMHGEDPDPEFVGQILYRLEQAGWMYRDRSGFLISEVGIRHFADLMLQVNTSIAYYSKDALQQKLYMAELIGTQLQALQRTDVATHGEIQTMCVMIEAATIQLRRDLHLYLQNRTAIRQIETIYELLRRVVEMLQDIIDSTVQVELLEEKRFLLEYGQRTVIAAHGVSNETFTEALRLSRLLNGTIRYTAINEKEFYDALVLEIRREFARENEMESPLCTLLRASENDDLDHNELHHTAWILSKVPGTVTANDWEAVLNHADSLFDDRGEPTPPEDKPWDLAAVVPLRMTSQQIDEIEQLGALQRESDEVENDLRTYVAYLIQRERQLVTLYDCVLSSPLPDRHGASILLDLLSEFGRLDWLQMDFEGHVTDLPNDLSWSFVDIRRFEQDPRFRSFTGFEQFRVPPSAQLEQIMELMQDIAKPTVVAEAERGES